MAPGYLITVCQPVSENPGRRYLRSAMRHDLVVPATRTVRFGRRSFAAAGPSTWNTLSSRTPKPETLCHVFLSSSEDCTVSQSVQYFISTLVTVLNCKSGRTLTHRTYLLTYLHLDHQCQHGQSQLRVATCAELISTFK